MTAPIVPRGTGGRTRPKTDVAQLWSGGVATAIVAGLAALVGVLAWRWLFGVPILAPKSDGAYGAVRTTDYVLAAAGAALVATALAQLLVASTPRPLVFFGWIVGLATVVVVLYPFGTAATLSEKGATATVDLSHWHRNRLAGQQNRRAFDESVPAGRGHRELHPRLIEPQPGQMTSRPASPAGDAVRIIRFPGWPGRH